MMNNPKLPAEPYPYDLSKNPPQFQLGHKSPKDKRPNTKDSGNKSE